VVTGQPSRRLGKPMRHRRSESRSQRVQARSRSSPKSTAPATAAGDHRRRTAHGLRSLVVVDAGLSSPPPAGNDRRVRTASAGLTSSLTSRAHPLRELDNYFYTREWTPRWTSSYRPCCTSNSPGGAGELGVARPWRVACGTAAPPARTTVRSTMARSASSRCRSNATPQSPRRPRQRFWDSRIKDSRHAHTTFILNGEQVPSTPKTNVASLGTPTSWCTGPKTVGSILQAARAHNGRAFIRVVRVSDIKPTIDHHYRGPAGHVRETCIRCQQSGWITTSPSGLCSRQIMAGGRKVKQYEPRSESLIGTRRAA